MSLNSFSSCGCPCHFVIRIGEPSHVCLCNCNKSQTYEAVFPKSDVQILLERIKKLEEHHVRQIDENRKISRRVDELEKYCEKINDLDDVIFGIRDAIEEWVRK